MSFGLNDELSIHDHQESPTGELVDYSFSTATDPDGQEPEPDGKPPQLDPEPDVDAESCESFCGPDEAQENHLGDGESFEDVRISYLFR